MIPKKHVSEEDMEIIGQRYYLTDTDIAKVNRKYKCSSHKYYLGDDLKGAELWETFRDKI